MFQNCSWNIYFYILWKLKLDLLHCADVIMLWLSLPRCIISEYMERLSQRRWKLKISMRKISKPKGWFWEKILHLTEKNLRIETMHRNSTTKKHVVWYWEMCHPEWYTCVPVNAQTHTTEVETEPKLQDRNITFAVSVTICLTTGMHKSCFRQAQHFQFPYQITER